MSKPHAPKKRTAQPGEQLGGHWLASFVRGGGSGHAAAGERRRDHEEGSRKASEGDGQGSPAANIAEPVELRGFDQTVHLSTPFLERPLAGSLGSPSLRSDGKAAAREHH